MGAHKGNTHGFQKGNKLQSNHGPSKITRDIKEAILAAAAKHGSDGKGKDELNGYLFRLARDYPKQFASLLGRMLPLQITGNVGNIIGAVNIVSVPVERFLSASDVQRLSAPPDDAVDVEFTAVEPEKAAS